MINGMIKLLKRYGDLGWAMNGGESAGQTVMHSHIHLIPRRDGDTRNPRGGVRGVILGKMDY